MTWAPFVEETGLAAPRGSEGGIIVADEEHELGARITLERDASTAPYAVTCGIYGWMVHTRYFSDCDVAQREYEAMKGGLSQILSLIPLTTDPALQSKIELVSKAIAEFIDRYPT